MFDYSVSTTFYLYSNVITDINLIEPYVANTDYLFFEPSPASSTTAMTISRESINESPVLEEKRTTIQAITIRKSPKAKQGKFRSRIKEDKADPGQ